jgi:folate-binding protein YgfZ
MATPLCPAELLFIAGSDAGAFAQAQFTSDVKSLSVGRWHWSAWLDALGRARHFFALLHAEPSRMVAWLPLGSAEAMRAELARFVMRSRVQLDAQIWVLHALGAEDATPAMEANEVIARQAGFTLRQPATDVRIAWLAPSNNKAFDRDALERWRRDDLAAGLPLLTDALAGEFVPQAIDLERLDAIRFDKGCYPGQEIAARLHFRGGNKRHLRHVHIDGAAPASATAINAADGRVRGHILYAVDRIDGKGSDALAVLTDVAEDAAAAMSVDGCEVHLLV